MALLAAAACGGSSPTSASGSPSAAVPTATVAVAVNAKLGQILVDGNGRTLYLFEADKGTASTCYGSCAAYWPPLLTSGKAQTGAGVNASLLGTTARNDGTERRHERGHVWRPSSVLRGDRSQSRGCHRTGSQQLRRPLERRRTGRQQGHLILVAG